MKTLQLSSTVELPEFRGKPYLKETYPLGITVETKLIAEQRARTFRLGNFPIPYQERPKFISPEKLEKLQARLESGKKLKLQEQAEEHRRSKRSDYGR